jgi:hypothetical protein
MGLAMLRSRWFVVAPGRALNERDKGFAIKLRLLVGVALAGLMTSSGVASARTSAPRCSNISASLGAGGNGITGGMYEWSLSITNRGARACTIQGRPFVRVAPTGYPVTVADMRPGEFGTSAHTGLIRLSHGSSVRAMVVIARNCGDFSKRIARTLRVRIGYGSASAVVSGEACARRGATVIVGEFQR